MGSIAQLLWALVSAILVSGQEAEQEIAVPISEPVNEESILTIISAPNEPTSSSPMPVTTLPNLSPGSITAWDDYCRKFDPASYCKYWQRPSRCQGSDLLCGLDGDLVQLGCVPPSADTSASVSGFFSMCDVYCDRFVASGSVCEWWRATPQCSGTEAPCVREVCEERVQMSERCDRFCQTFAGPMSFCKNADNTCHGSEISCAPAACVRPNGPCDALCQGLNGPGSFCLFWRDRKQCAIGGQDCDVSQCF
jgi:hypothetical protein